MPNKAIVLLGIAIGIGVSGIPLRLNIIKPRASVRPSMGVLSQEDKELNLYRNKGYIIRGQVRVNYTRGPVMAMRCIKNKTPYQKRCSVSARVLLRPFPQ